MNEFGIAPGIFVNGVPVSGVPGGMIVAGSACTISFLRSIFQKSTVALVPTMGSKTMPSV